MTHLSLSTSGATATRRAITASARGLVLAAGLQACGAEPPLTGSAPGQTRELILIGQVAPALRTGAPLFVSVVFVSVYRGPDVARSLATTTASADGSFVLRVPMPIPDAVTDLGGVGVGVVVATTSPLPSGDLTGLTLIGGAPRVALAWRAQGADGSGRYPWVTRFPAGGSCGLVERGSPHDQLSPSPCVAIDVVPYTDTVRGPNLN
jgi:hypothetical protein